ncbi:hypothetical protein TrVE_jg9885 [Triparma verrucosa]|uniref:Uncharacterized protein n=1 Tax=Triparma verrucosa TaxID=1606542 RepID=A0A9W6Z9G4_9STRA|nr:hypothetical protein TrVE_jg9885 [Triparma verrucosa]
MSSSSTPPLPPSTPNPLNVEEEDDDDDDINIDINIDIDTTNIDPTKLFKKLCQRQYNAIIKLVNKQSIHTHLKKDGPLTKLNNGNNFLVNVPNLLPLIDHAASQDVAEQESVLQSHTSDLTSLFAAVSAAPNDPRTLAKMKERIELGERVIKCVKDERSSQDMKTVALLCLKHSPPLEDVEE